MARLVVIGAGLAGVRAVEAARRSGFEGAITLIGDEPHPPYDRPPLSKEFLTGEAAAPEFFRSMASLRRDLDVELLLGIPATSLHTAEQVVIAAGKQIRYSGLVIATGATARDLPGGRRLAGVHTLRTLEDALALRQALQPGSRVVIVGAGFIGSEVACAARRRGAEATVIEAAPVPLARAVGDVIGIMLAKLHARLGTRLRCGVAVESVEGTAHVEAVRLSDGSRLPADVVVVGIGSAPATDWLQGSGLELDDGVVCDETLNAGAPGVYAAGDVARWFNPLFGQTMRLEHWTTAAAQGRVAARHAIDPSRAAPCAIVPYFWSDWDDDRIQFVGIPGSDEVQVVAGDPDHRVFLALCRRGERICGALGLNQSQSVLRLRAMIARRARWIEALEFTRAGRQRAASTPTARDSRPLASGARNGQRVIPLRKAQQTTENGGGGRYGPMATLEVPGARLYYETRGSGPVMIMVPGSNGDADIFGPVREHLTGRHTVVTYDRRGFSRSQLTGPQDYGHRLETDADDVRRLIEHVSGGPAVVFGASSGAVIALEVLTDHSSAVGTLVPFEPPAVRQLPGGQAWLDFFFEIYDIYLRSGIEPAISTFRKRAFSEADRLVMDRSPDRRDRPMNPYAAGNATYWFERELRQYPAVNLDLAMLRARADAIMLAVGSESRGYPCYEVNRELSKKLSKEIIELPGGHVGYVAHPAEFAAALMQAIPVPGTESAK